MSTCPSCDGECPAGARFCPSCGAALAAPSPHAVERKVVTTMFCDLVDFTGFCEQADSEDADRLLRAFYALARQAIETFGGVVEKFVGDAVVGVFGVPVAHEDDAERAVHTALRLRDRIAELPQIAGRRQQLRIGINTGSAVVRLDVLPGSGEGFLVGDAVNTAARLQQLAPPMGIVVGETTQELSARSVDYARFDSAALKGKRTAVKCWLVRGPLSRMGADPRQPFAASLVDREVELGILRGLLKKVRTSSHPQFALVTGEAGIGKSRLVFELLRYIEHRPWIVRWRQGRCPAYGDGLTFWALGEIFKEQLGVLERDEVATVEAKLAHALAGVDDREWLAARLRPLLGLEGAAASREENFAAWRRFLEIIAADCPAVVVFEDLHWASEATLAFLRHLVENAGEVPLLAIGTARPELLQVLPDMADHLSELGSSQRVVRIDLEPLTESETEELVVRVGRGLGELPEASRAISERAAGNPLFVEQLVRHLEGEPEAADLAADAAAGGAAGGVVLKERVTRALPESLQSLIGARLDDLPPERKALLTDAAVVGEVFWTGAVAALDHGDRTAAEEGLMDLAQRDLLRHNRDSSLSGENEFAFRHGLIRDVAYAQLTRSERATKHAAVARWLEAIAGERKDEVAEILAHHYAAALDLAGRARESELRDALVEPTLGALKAAGDHALPLDVSAAEAHYERAVHLAPKDCSLRPGLLAAWGSALAMSGKVVEGARILEEGVEGLLALGDRRPASVAMTRLSRALMDMNDRQASGVAADAVALLDGDGPSPELLDAVTNQAFMCVVGSDPRGALEAVKRAARIAETLGLPLDCELLLCRADARCFTGDVGGGLEDLHRATDVLASQNVSASAHIMAAELTATFVSVEKGVAIHEAGLCRAQARHDERVTASVRLGVFEDRVLLGRWDEAVADHAPLETFLRDSGQVYTLQDAWSVRLLLLVLECRTEEARSLCVRTDLQSEGLVTSPLGYLADAATRCAVGDIAAARSSLEWLVEHTWNFCLIPKLLLWWPMAVRLAISCCDDDLSARLAHRLIDSPASPRSARATVEALEAAWLHHFATAAERFAEATDCWREQGVPFERAQALLWRGRCLLELDQEPAAYVVLTEARAIFKRLGAKPALAETDELMRQVPSV